MAFEKEKKVSHQEIKQDLLVKEYYGAINFYNENQKLVHGILIGIVAIIAVIFLINYRTKANNAEASTQLGRMITYYDRGQYETAIEGVKAENLKGLQSIVDEYGSTKSGEMAAFLLANSYFHLGKYDLALKYFKQVSFNEKELTGSAYAGSAACYEAMKQYKEAGWYFERAAGESTVKSTAAEYAFQSAVNYAAADNRPKAVELFHKAKKDAPSSVISRESDRRLAEMGVIE